MSAIKVDTLKRCSKCGKMKPLTMYHVNKYTKTGYHYWCKDCRFLAYVEKYQRNKRHKDTLDRISRIKEGWKR